jgi:hypothetical protein
MLLNEFFGHFNVKSEKKNTDEDLKLKEEGMCDDIFEFILNDDDLHKRVFFPIAEEIVNKPTTDHTPDEWLPMVNKGCMKFYHRNALKEDPSTLFNKKFRENLCHKLADHYNPDILKGIYDLGK